MEEGQLKSNIRDYSIHSVSKVLRVIDILAEMPGGLGVTAIAEKLSVAKSSAHRLVTTLEKADYVSQDPLTGRYRLTFKIFELGSNLLRSRGFNEHVAYLLEQLSITTNCIVKMGVHESGKMLCVYRVNSREVFHMDMSVGTRLPLHCTGMGKAYLATLKEEDLGWFLRFTPLKPRTSNTITTSERLIREVRQIRTRGFAFDKGENSDEVWCVAAAVVDHLNHTVSLLSISGLASVMKQRDLNQLGNEVRETAKKISIIIGYA